MRPRSGLKPHQVALLPPESKHDLSDGTTAMHHVLSCYLRMNPAAKYYEKQLGLLLCM